LRKKTKPNKQTNKKKTKKKKTTTTKQQQTNKKKNKTKQKNPPDCGLVKHKMSRFILGFYSTMIMYSLEGNGHQRERERSSNFTIMYPIL
jgi:hypothetical protein